MFRRLENVCIYVVVIDARGRVFVEHTDLGNEITLDSIIKQIHS